MMVMNTFEFLGEMEAIERLNISEKNMSIKYQILTSTNFLISKADGASGHIGKPIPARIIGKAEIVEPWVGSTETFLGIGKFETRNEAENCLKYIKTKFARTMLGVLKVTQDITPTKWKYVPLQDFTVHSDIDWSKSVAEIDQQLYRSMT